MGIPVRLFLFLFPFLLLRVVSDRMATQATIRAPDSRLDSFALSSPHPLLFFADLRWSRWVWATSSAMARSVASALVSLLPCSRRSAYSRLSISERSECPLRSCCDSHRLHSGDALLHALPSTTPRRAAGRLCGPNGRRSRGQNESGRDTSWVGPLSRCLEPQ